MKTVAPISLNAAAPMFAQSLTFLTVYCLSLITMSPVAVTHASVPAQEMHAQGEVHDHAHQHERPDSRRGRCNDPLCGLRAVHAALAAFPNRVQKHGRNLSELSASTYVSCPSGSSAADIVRAVSDAGYHAAYGERITRLDRLRLTTPVIVEIGELSESGVVKDTHFVTIFPAGDGSLLASHGPDLIVDSSEIAELWRLPIVSYTFVTERPSSFAVHTTTGRIASFSALVALVGLGCWLTHKQFFLSGAVWSWKAQGAVALLSIPAAALVCSTAWFSLGQAQIVVAPPSVAGLRSALIDSELAPVSVEEARQLLEQGGTFVDARAEASFNRRRVAGAINLPPDCADAVIRTQLAGHSGDQPIIVYCSSERCPLAGVMARRLVLLGYRNVSVFTGGMEAWDGEVAPV